MGIKEIFSEQTNADYPSGVRTVQVRMLKKGADRKRLPGSEEKAGDALGKDFTKMRT